MENMDERSPIVRIGDSLRKLNQAFFQATRREAEACGVTPIQFLVLRILKKYPHIGLNELSELMYTGASTVSGIVERLVRAGLIKRERAEKDRRSVVLNLTSAGEELVVKAHERIMQRLSPLRQLSDEEVDHLLRIHETIIQILQQTREDT